MKISNVAIVHHRTPEVLEDALARLARHAPSVPVTVLDTSPDPVTPERVGRVHAGARVAACRNHSYADVVNRALREAPGELTLVMNADVRVGADTLPSLAAPFADPRVALTGPLARVPGGPLQDQGLPYRLWTARLRGAGSHATLDAPWLSGCLFVARVAAARDAGGMDASLRFFNEDLEWSLRLRARGWRVVLVGAEVVHLGGSATPDRARFRIEGLRGGLVVARRHRRPWRRTLHRAAVGGYAAMRARTAPPERRPAWHAVSTMMRRGAVDESPFGATLDVANARFAADFPAAAHGWDRDAA